MKQEIINILIFLFLAITFEFLFEEILFRKSIPFEKMLQTNYKSLIPFFKKVTKIGGVIGHAIVYMITFLQFPLIYIYNYSLMLVYTPYLTSITKIIHGDGRPFFEDNSLFQACSGGFGNPSGHSLCSTGCYLAFAKLFIDYYNFKNIKKILIYSCAILVIIFINFSRLILGLHAIDQVIYGDIYGFLLYYLLFHVLHLNERDSKEFFENFLDVKYAIKQGVFWCLCFLTLIFCWNVFPLIDNSVLIKYEQIVYRLCPNFPKYDLLTNEIIFEALTIFAYLGMYAGLYMLSSLCSEKYPNKYDEINYFSKNNKNVFSKYILLGCNMFPFILFWIIPTDAELKFFYSLKVAIPLMVFTFLSFGFNLYYYIKFGYANQKIYSDKGLLEGGDDENEYKNLENE